MKRFLRRLVISFERDDFFFRVVFILSGVLFGGIGIALLDYGSTYTIAPALAVLFWTLAILLTAVVDFWLRVAPCRRNRGWLNSWTGTCPMPGDWRKAFSWLLLSICRPCCSRSFSVFLAFGASATCMTPVVGPHRDRRGNPNVLFPGGVRKLTRVALRAPHRPPQARLASSIEFNWRCPSVGTLMESGSGAGAAGLKT